MAQLKVSISRKIGSVLKGILTLQQLSILQLWSGEWRGFHSAGMESVLATDLMSVLPFTRGVII